MSKTYWTYIIRCSDGSYYTGSTSSIEKRISEHQQGIIPGYTKNKRPIELVFSEYFEDVYNAISAERQIKGWSRAKKEALIQGDFELLKALAKKNWSR
jgi:predicted GIY-YIG superfamily endonuclease